MHRRLTRGLIAAIAIVSAGTWAVVNAQDPQAEDAHDHSPTAIHNDDGSHYDLDDPAAYPDPEGFASMYERVSNVIGRLDGQQIRNNLESLNLDEYEEGIRNGLAETSSDRAAGYDLGRRVATERPDADIEALIEGIRMAAAETSESRVAGYRNGNGYRENEIELSTEQYMDGLREALAVLDAMAAGEEPPATTLTEEQVRETVTAFSYIIQQRQFQKLLDEGAAYRAEVVAEGGWTETESGLLYRVIEEGEGERPDANDVVTCHYEGKLTNGSVFDSSYEGGEPIEFGLDRVIGGWTEGVQLMQVGAKYEFVIPPDLAYGEPGIRDRRTGQTVIPPNATLRFTVELMGFVDTPDPPAEDDREPLGD